MKSLKTTTVSMWVLVSIAIALCYTLFWVESNNEKRMFLKPNYVIIDYVIGGNSRRWMFGDRMTMYGFGHNFHLLLLLFRCDIGLHILSATVFARFVSHFVNSLQKYKY